MEIRTTEEARENIENFAKRLLNLEHQKKSLAEDVKNLKQEFKEEGVPVAIVGKAVKLIMQDKQKTDAEKFEEATIKEWLESNTEIDDEIGILIAK